jgi:hypothetical protein
MIEAAVIALVVCLVAVCAVAVLARLAQLKHQRRLPSVSEWQARQNAAPLTSAIADKHVTKEKR